MLLVAWHAAIDRHEASRSQVVGNYPHTLGVRGIALATELLKLFDDRPHQANLKDIGVIIGRSRNAFQTRAVVDIRLI